MKKIFLITALLMFVASSAFAVGLGVDQTGTFTIGGSADSGGTATDLLTCGLSSNVHAYYNTDGTSAAPAQWYTIGTYHVGGTEVYATAQDITSLYKLDAGKTPGDLFTWTGLPTDSGSSNVWSADVWKQL